ncbi:diaminobutyrate acetyltransferase [Pontiellaceae bacterium B1224]|nr:diaminobutyrate acetyltransferase [Pontiellaceae bacterium B1224]
MSIAQKIEFETPQSTDGFEVHRLVQACPPLDENSMYCNLLQCTHFYETSIAARLEGELVGFVSGYVKPAASDTLFIWQVAVAESARGQGLARRMILALLDRPACRGINQLETTITPSNTASRNLFARLADTLEAPVRLTDGFDKEKHFKSKHESEQLWRIGPIPKNKMR